MVGCESLFLRQLKVLMWKNNLLKWRYWVTLIVEIAIPVVILVALGGLKTIVKPTVVDTTIPVQASAYPNSLLYINQNLVQYGMCQNNLLWYCDASVSGSKSCTTPADIKKNCQRRYIAVAPSSSSSVSATDAAVEYTSFANNLLGSVDFGGFFENLITTYSNDTFVTFADEATFLSYITSSEYSVDPASKVYSSAIIFNDGAPSWEYTVRVNRTTTYDWGDQDSPYTNTQQKNVDITAKYGKQYVDGGNLQPYMENYIYSGYTTLMDSVNTFIATATCRSSGKCSQSEGISLEMDAGVQFPNKYVELSGFWTALGSAFAIVMIISILYPFSNMIYSLVQEKEFKLKEGMLMMALRSDALFTSWLLHFLFLIFPLAIILTIAGSTLFTYSEGIFIFFYWFVFFLSSVSYCFFVSSFFTRSRTASIVGTLGFFAGYFIYIGVGSTGSRSTTLAAMLHPASAFTYGTLAFSEYEDAQIGITSDTWTVSNTYPVSFQDCLNMLFIDFLWLAAASWYLNQVWPSEFGTHKPWYFIFLPSTYIACVTDIFPCLKQKNVTAYRNVIPKIVDDEGLQMSDVVPIEPVNESLLLQISQGTCVDIQNLYKEFHTSNGVKTAVDGLNLTMYSGQITALLGHNGAGKTTVISMLSGLITADSGSASIEGNNINDNMDEIRKNLGVCPQHDVLFPDLTVEEHLVMFAAFKGMKGKELKADVDKMIVSVGLTEKRHARSKTLSGGQKRKLSVGIAFIGGSKVVILDECTSGMDPYSRRFTWDVIRSHKEGRVVILTTHFMDEADILGDRIAIMGDGKLRCCGSSLFLKKNYGVGYNMTVEKVFNSKFDTNHFHSIIQSYVPEATILTDAGSELTIQLPLTSCDKFEPLFTYIDANQHTLFVESYGMSVTTLEEVFIKVAEGTHTVNIQSSASKTAAAVNATNEKAVVTHGIHGNDVESAENALDFDSESIKISQKDVMAMFYKHMYALYKKRILYFSRDTKAWMFQYGVPILFMLIGMIVYQITTLADSQPSKSIVPAMYNAGISNDIMPSVYNKNSYGTNVFDPVTCPYTPDVIVGAIPDYSNYPFEKITLIEASITNTSQALYDNMDAFESSQWGGYTFSNVNSNQGSTRIQYYLHSNFTGAFATPLFHNILADGLVRAIDSSASIKLNIHPLPYTRREAITLESYDAGTIANFLLLAVPFLPAAFATYVVREREVKAKHQQFVSGISIPGYWISTWLFDVVSYLPTAFAFIVLFVIFPRTDLITNADAIGPAIGCLILYGTSITGFAYLIAFNFKTPAGVQVSIIFTIFILGFVLTIVGIVLRFIPNTHDLYMDVIRYIFALFPPFALGDAYHNLCLIQTYGFLELTGNKVYHPLDWDITGMNLTFLAWESVVYLLLTIAVEYAATIPSLQALLTPVHIPDVKLDLDDDVRAEAEAIRDGTGPTGESSIVISDVKKVYPGGKFAVKGVSLDIKKGECFGLLGINGAGKSSLLSILSGEISPSSGGATLNGLNLMTQLNQARRLVGYCPQFDALFELLTGREHLELYARIKGIKEEHLTDVVNQKIQEMGLTEYADRAAGTYSGGNKRKLSVSLAMIGNPSICYLDEPSTGMDPVARRLMWDIIANIVTKRKECSLILTTHSMEECEALCTRIGIMVGGYLRCLGSAQRLRSRFGHGFQMEIGFRLPTNEETFVKSLGILKLLKVGDDVLSAPLPSVMVNRSMCDQALDAIDRSMWKSRIATGDSGSDLNSAFDVNGTIAITTLASWIILEGAVDFFCRFLTSNFGQFVVRERQSNKFRIEISMKNDDGTSRKLSVLFGLLERNKGELFIQEYSISQTSLEQIFNQFAATQEEEQGAAVGLVR